MSNNKDFKVKNGIKPTSYFEGVGTVTSGSVTVGYGDASTWSYDSVSFSVPEDGRPTDVTFNNDGTKMYITGDSNNVIKQYSLSSAFDLSTASYDSVTFSVTSQDTIPRGMRFNDDGSKMYVVGDATNSVHQYSLSTAFDLSTASYDSVDFYASQDSAPKGLFFKPDGTKMYVVGSSSYSVHQYSLSTAFDLSTASYDSVNINVSSQDSSPTGLAFSSDGIKMYVVGSSSDAVYQYSLSTEWDLSTASYDSVSFSVSAQDGTPTGITFNNNGTKMYMVGENSTTVFQYSTGSTLDTATLDLSTGSVFEVTPTADTQVSLSNPAASGTVSGATLLLDGVAEGYDLSGAAYDSVSFSVASQEATPTGVTFNTDGTKMFICGSNGDEVNEYALSTAFDISTASFTTNFSVAGQEITPEDVVFKPDGTKMYIIGRTGDDIGQYSLSTAYDISTASFDSVTFSVSSQSAFPTGMRFNNDGTKFFICDRNNYFLFQYSLSTAYDISSASYDSVSYDFSAQFDAPNAISLNGDGTKLFAIGANTRLMYQYSLSTAFDISTISYDSVSFALENSGGDPAGMTFNSDGTKMYVVDYNTDLVYQYTTGSAYTVTYDSAIQFGGGTAPDSPLSNETDVLTFSTRDGGTSYQAAIAIDGAS